MDTFDCQMGPVQDSILIFVTGTLNMDDSDTFKFSQVFQVLPNGTGGYFCNFYFIFNLLILNFFIYYRPE